MTTTIDLPEMLKRKAEQVANAQGVSLDELVKNALERLFTQTNEDDPFYRDEEVYTGTVPEDLSARHDKYLYGQIPIKRRVHL